MVQAVKDFPYDVTPSFQCDWYLFDLVPSGPKTVRLSWSKHPTVGSVKDVQTAFDGGAEILARDDDAPLHDGTPGLDAIGDDVNTYIEFIVPKAKKSTFPAGYSGDRFLNITQEDEAGVLIDAQFSNLKVVGSIVIGGRTYKGYAWPWHDGILVTPPGVTGRVVVHEYGHVVGLEHRGWSADAARGTWENPGTTSDTTALMYQTDPPGNEVNRFERTWFRNYTPALFND